VPQSSVLDGLASTLWAALVPQLWWIVPLAIAMVALGFPAVGRRPRSSKRDPWRLFKFAARATVMERAGHRCEAPLLLAWGRCSALATDADHIMPWSRGGPTVVSNGQALCRGHNRAKAAFEPPWWYVLGLERRRRAYFPPDADVRVRATMSDEDRAARLVPRGAQPARRIRRQPSTHDVAG